MSTPIQRQPCPYCQELIAVTAVKCRFCGEEIFDEDFEEDVPTVEVRQERPPAVSPSQPAVSRPPLPKTVMAAAIIWLAFGCIMLLNGFVSVALISPDDGAPGASCGVLLGVLFGIGFLFVGWQTVRGQAVDTLGNGIGSILLGLPNGVAGALFMMMPAAAGGKPALPVALVVGIVSLTCCLGLLTAGVLALVGRADYKAWRQAEKAKRPKKAPGTVEASEFIVPTNVSGWSMASCYMGVVGIALPVIGLIFTLPGLLFGIIALWTRKKKADSYGAITSDVRAIIGVVLCGLSVLGHAIILGVVLVAKLMGK